MPQSVTSPTAPIVTHGDLGVNATSFARHIRAANLSPATQRTYLASVARLAAFLESQGMPTDVANIRREHLEAFIEDQLVRWKPATAANRYSGIRPFFRWLEEEGEIAKGENPMERMRKPKLPEHSPPVLSEAEQDRILAACRGVRPEDLRDTAIVRTFLSTGARLSEIANLRWTPDDPEANDIDLDRGIVRIREGKGRRERISFLNAEAVKAIDRYERRGRRRHSKAGLPWLWLGEKGRMTDSGIAQLLRRRGRIAAIDGLHAHQFRHSYAHAWLSAGGQEGDLMALAGWRSREMLSRYARSAASGRAIDAARRMSLARDGR